MVQLTVMLTLFQLMFSCYEKNFSLVYLISKQSKHSGISLKLYIVVSGSLRSLIDVFENCQFLFVAFVLKLQNIIGTCCCGHGNCCSLLSLITIKC